MRSTAATYRGLVQNAGLFVVQRTFVFTVFRYPQTKFFGLHSLGTSQMFCSITLYTDQKMFHPEIPVLLIIHSLYTV